MAAAVIELDVAIAQLRNIDLFEKGHYAAKCYVDQIKYVLRPSPCWDYAVTML